MQVSAKARLLTDEDLLCLEVGAGILGTGGGGNPYLGRLRAQQTLRRGYSLSVLPLEELGDESWVLPLGGIGAPLIGFERLREGHEGLRCIRSQEKRFNRKIDAIGCEEIGGANSMEPLVSAALAGLPVVDADGMGRAFPEMQMSSYSIYGHCSTPSCLCDLHGNEVIIERAITEKWHETLARACVVAQGGTAILASAPIQGAFFKKCAIPHSYTRAIRLGQAVRHARKKNADPVAAICQHENGRLVFTGKIIDVARRLEGGFVRGEAHIAGVGDFAEDQAQVLIQNENLAFQLNGEYKVVVPDLIIILDLDTGDAITTELLHYGQRVAVLGLPCHPLLRTPEALEVLGPGAFGLAGVTYQPMEE